MEGIDLRSNDDMTSHHEIVEAAAIDSSKTIATRNVEIDKEEKEESKNNMMEEENCNDEGTLNAGNFKLKQNEEKNTLVN